MQNLNWYHTLNKPFLTPPDWIFAPVWSVLYLMIFISFILFLKSKNTHSKIIPTVIFLIQLFLNLIWSPIFFGLEKPKAALLIIVFLWISILVTILSFYKHSKIASFLLIPYLLWVTFAVYLNFEFCRLN